MSKTTPAPAETTVTYRCRHRIKHDGRWYPAAAEIELTPRVAELLRAVGAVEPLGA